MKNANTSKTAIKYKSWILNAFVELLNQYSYEEITVKQIVLQADVSRQTYYRHFKDKEDILGYYAKLLSEELSKQLLELKVKSFYEVVVCYFSFCNKKSNVLTLFKSSKLEFFYNKMMLDTIDSISACFTKCDKREFELLKSFLIGGLFQMMLTWIETEKKETPEELAQLICRYINV